MSKSTTTTQPTHEGTTPASDKAHVATLVAIGSDRHRLQHAQHEAAQKLLDAVGEEYPHDGCAITLSVLLQEGGIAVHDVYLALELGNVLRKRGWKPVPMGKQEPGDVGSTCGPSARHGSDHIYLVLKNLNGDEMVVADNQSSAPHFRWASGRGGKTPTKFFLRAP